jgi:predicted small metal-binding protein
MCTRTIGKEVSMSRKYIDCRDYPGDIQCSVALSADTDEELLEAVVQHGTTVHGYEDTPEFREKIVKEFKDGTPPE